MFIPSIHYITFIDELCASGMFAIALADCIAHNNWRRYKVLWIIIFILIGYAIYSLTAVHYNKPAYIFTDIIIELKPFIPFVVFFAIRPELTDKDKSIIKKICIVNCSIISIALFCGYEVIKLVIFHPMYCGLGIFVSCMFYLFVCLDKDNRPSKADIVTLLIFMTIGLLSNKTKYYGAYVVTLYFLFLYRPGIMRHFTIKQIVLIAILAGGVLAVSWNKIDFFFISGGGTTGFDPKVVESFARPVLYVTGWQILFDHFPFGTGLASFASAASIMNYSDVYYEYGINKVWGLLPDNPAFACDTFYPSLAQFGIFGPILFIWFWVYAYSYLRVLTRNDIRYYKYPFIIGSIIICSLLIESTTATTLTHNSGLLLMCLLGIICVYGDKIKDKQKIHKKEEDRKRTLLAKI